MRKFFTDRFTSLDIASKIGDLKLIKMNQIHSSHVSIVDKNSLHVTPKTDAIISTDRGVALCVVVADCNPILCFDVKKGVIAAVHAGRVGSYGEILKKTLLVMQKEFTCKAQDLHVSIGPSIRACCYEVGEEVIEGFENFTQRRDGKIYLDLLALNLAQLRDMEIREQNIEISPICTCCDTNYFSYRRENTSNRFCGVIHL